MDANSNDYPEFQRPLTAEENGYKDGLPVEQNGLAKSGHSEGSNLREIALAVATQLASSAQPGESVEDNVINAANKYLAFLEGRPAEGAALDPKAVYDAWAAYSNRVEA